jgi:hypothetical protein
LGSARDFVRVSLSKTKDRDLTREAFAAEIATRAFDGEYYRVVEGIHDEAEGKLRLKAVSVSNRLEVGTITFDIKTGNSTIEWHDSDPDE